MRWWWWLFSRSVVSTSLRPRGLLHARPGFPVLRHLPGLLKLLSVELMMPSNHLILCCPLLFLASSFVFSSSRFSGVPSISVSLVLFIKKWLCIVDWIWHWLEFKMFSFDRYLWWFSLIYYYENSEVNFFIFFFFHSFSIYAIAEYWAEFPVLYNRSLLIICFKYSSVYMSTPNSLTIPSPHWATKS